jgi:hypothetical protein
MYALIDISNQMIEDSAFDMEGEIRGTVRAGQNSCSVWETTGIGAMMWCGRGA